MTNDFMGNELIPQRHDVLSRRILLSGIAASVCMALPLRAAQGMKELKSRHLFSIHIDLHPILDLGATPAGQRRVVPVAGGHFSGERLRGTILPHTGSDLLLTRADGSFQQDVRMMLRTDSDALILMTYRGVRHSSPEVSQRIARGETVSPAEYYLRTAPFFETSAPPYAWLNHIVAIGVGERRPNGALYEVFEIL